MIEEIEEIMDEIDESKLFSIVNIEDIPIAQYNSLEDFVTDYHKKIIKAGTVIHNTRPVYISLGTITKEVPNAHSETDFYIFAIHEGCGNINSCFIHSYNDNKQYVPTKEVLAGNKIVFSDITINKKILKEFEDLKKDLLESQGYRTLSIVCKNKDTKKARQEYSKDSNLYNSTKNNLIINKLINLFDKKASVAKNIFSNKNTLSVRGVDLIRYFDEASNPVQDKIITEVSFYIENV